jgi:hypothetical protein
VGRSSLAPYRSELEQKEQSDAVAETSGDDIADYSLDALSAPDTRFKQVVNRGCSLGCPREGLYIACTQSRDALLMCVVYSLRTVRAPFPSRRTRDPDGGFEYGITG